MDNKGAQPLTTIAQIQNALAQKRQEVGQRYAALPQTEANLRASLYGGDQTLSSLRNNEADKIKQLYNHDQQVASNYQPQTEGFVEDPAAKARYGSMILGNTGGELADIQKGIANRRDVLGDALEKGMKIAMYGLEGLKQEYSGLEGERDFMQKQKEHEDEMSLKRSELATGGSATERATNQAISRLQKEVGQGVPFYELYPRYISELPESQIREIYNSGPLAKKAGAARESSTELQQSLAVAKKPQSLTADQKKQAGYADASLRLLSDIEKKANGFKSTGPVQGANTRLFENINPKMADGSLIELNSNLGPIREQVINLISGAQVSDAESKRVQSWIPDISKSPEKNRQDMNSLRGWLQEKYRAATGNDYKSASQSTPKAQAKPAQNSGGQVKMQSPNGQLYMVDRAEAAEAKKNGWKEAK